MTDFDEPKTDPAPAPEPEPTLTDVMAVARSVEATQHQMLAALQNIANEIGSLRIHVHRSLDEQDRKLAEIDVHVATHGRRLRELEHPEHAGNGAGE